MKWLNAAALSIAFAISNGARCEDLGFFAAKIDYWDESRPDKAETPKNSLPQMGAERKAPFDWALYLDPTSDEFFREGEYLPPAPFLAAARDPSDENLKMWLRHIDRKNAVAERFQKRLQEYVGKNAVSAPELARPPNRLAQSESPALHPERFRLRLYFDSTCPHCRHMFGTLAELQSQGFAVDGKQVDRGELGPNIVPFAISPATSYEVARQKIEGVPLLLIANVERGVMSRISGYHDTKEVLSVIQSMNH